jgi:phosphopantothenoylcysteine decarboxylase / phosphopantothenate---cysteine ligase
MNGRKILLGVTGGIAAYKAVELTRLFVKSGARVQVVMTDAATKFVTPLTFEALTGRHVFVEMFPGPGEFSPWHTELASWPDIAVIAPATANHMARLAAGLADDLLTTIMLTFERPRVLCPSMNHRMWANPATQDNLSQLKRRGFRFVMPEEGEMARPGEGEGIGRLAEPEAIVREVSHILSAPQDLRGVRVLVTAGRTEESWDPVRVLTNRATGRMGFALAEDARERGADVMLIHGPTDVIPPVGVRVRRVTTAQDMANAVKQEFPQAKIVLMAAAVADYTFPKMVEHKIKKGDPEQEVHLVPTEDILKSLADRKGERIVVGFALETENLLENALKKLRDKHMDIVVANNPLAMGSGFAGETNQVLIIHRTGRVTELPLQSKREAARDILNAVISIFRNPEPEPEPEVELADEPEDFDILPVEDEPEVFGVDEPGSAEHSRSKRNRRKRDRRGRGPKPGVQPDGAPVVAQDAALSAPVIPVVEVTPKPAAPAPKVVAPPAPRQAPPPPRVTVTRTPRVETPAPVVAAAEPAPTEPVAQSAELPFPGPAGTGPKKSGRSRRGGRRAARARARKEQLEGGAPTVNDPPPVAEVRPEPVHVRAPEPVKVPEPVKAPEPVKPPKPAPVIAAPAPVVEAVASADPGEETKPKPRGGKRSSGAVRKTGTKKPRRAPVPKPEPEE